MVRKFWDKFINPSPGRLVWVIFLLVLVGLFLYLKIVPSGHMTYSRSWPRGLASGQGFIYDFKPGERLDISDPSRLRMIGDPLYFSLFTPRSFNQAEVTVRYRDNLTAKTPIIEIGVLKNKLTGAYDLAPLENKRLREIGANWSKLEREEISGERLVLYQADNNYQTVEEFILDLEKGKLRSCLENTVTCLATYNYPWSAPYYLPDYTDITPLEITQPFRGAHQFYVYLPAGPWQFSFNFVDLNLDPAADPVTVTVADSRGRSVSYELPDEDKQPASGQSQAREMEVTGQADQAGLYKVQLKSSDDIVVAKLSSPSNQLAFINKFWPVSSDGSIKLYTDSAYLQVKTFNPSSLGPVTFGDQTSLIDETYRQFSLLRSGFSRQISLTHEDVILETNGVFSLSPETLINPNPDRVDRFFTPRPEIIYLIARYQEPVEENGVKEAKAILDLSGAPRDQGRYSFLLSVPGLGAETPGSSLEVEEIRVELRGRSLWQKLQSWLSR